MTELEEQTIRLKEDAIQSHKNSNINEEFTKTKQQLEISQSQLTEAHSEIDVIKRELLSHKQAAESLQHELSINQEAFDAKLREQQSSLEGQFQLSVGKLQEEARRMEIELKSKIDQVTSDKENMEVVYTHIDTVIIMYVYVVYTHIDTVIIMYVYVQVQSEQQFREQQTKYQQQEERLKLQLEELNKEKGTVIDELKNAVAEKEAFEHQLAELRTQDDKSKDENDGSTSPEIIPSNFSFGSSDIQVSTTHTYCKRRVIKL